VKFIVIDTFMVCWKSTSRQGYLLDGNMRGVLEGKEQNPGSPKKKCKAYAPTEKLWTYSLGKE